MYKCTPAGVKSNQNRDQQHEQHGHDMIHTKHFSTFYLNLSNFPIFTMKHIVRIQTPGPVCIIIFIFCISNIGCSPYNYNAVAIWSYVTGLL